MKKEDIEKAAVDSCVFENDIFNPELTPYYEKGFKDGAYWRINSVWHNPNEEPATYDNLLIIENKNAEFGLGYRFDPARTRRWAYVKDLIQGKE